MESPQATLIITNADFPEVIEPLAIPPEMLGRSDALDVMIYCVKHHQRQSRRLLEAAKAKYPGRSITVEHAGNVMGFVP